MGLKSLKLASYTDLCPFPILFPLFHPSVRNSIKPEIPSLQLCFSSSSPLHSFIYLVRHSTIPLFFQRNDRLVQLGRLLHVSCGFPKAATAMAWICLEVGHARVVHVFRVLRNCHYHLQDQLFFVGGAEIVSFLSALYRTAGKQAV